MRPRPLILLAGILAAPLCWAQQSGTAGTPSVSQPGLTRVEGGVADVDPLGMSLRQLSVDLRQPVGFGGVYRVPASRSPTGRAAFARLSGATAAVFDESQYVFTRSGLTPTVPAGTVFYIGGLPEARPVARPAGHSTAVSTAVDTRELLGIDLSATANKVLPQPLSPAADAAELTPAQRIAAQWPDDGHAPDPRESAAPSPFGVWGDEAYRASRVAELLKRAAAALMAETPAK